MNINVGDKFIKRAMETGVMLDDYGASRTENSETCVKASVNSNGEELNKEDKSTINMKLIKGINDALEEQDGVIEELEEELSRLQAELLEGNIKDQGGYSTPCNQHDFDNNFDCEGGVYSHETVMKERVLSTVFVRAWRVYERRRYRRERGEDERPEQGGNHTVADERPELEMTRGDDERPQQGEAERAGQQVVRTSALGEQSEDIRSERTGQRRERTSVMNEQCMDERPGQVEATRGEDERPE
ncbi:hypothetical protein LR48_Vigan05g111000 [Vigna angularis]|uniref:Uncharacterized protein n=1 Tax=Phaseolus angularis TaxID=3914 RepID=A0A0L9ULE6_PHAAN|nr:hypothetical protein LR48_Vigan05g111000 [Vigna angularis]